MSFHEIRFPEDISFGSSGGPEFSTNVVTIQSGHEQRNSNWSEARARYNIIHAVKNQAQLDVLIEFFRARQGKAYGFRFKDWADYKAEAQDLGLGDGIKTDFQIIKSYTSGAVSYIRNISKLVSGSIKIYFDDVEQEAGYSVDINTGVISFDSAPNNQTQISADFEFDVPVRFDTDFLSSQFDSYGVNSINDIPLIEIRTQ